LVSPTVETLRGRKKSRIESQSISAPKLPKTRTEICPLCNKDILDILAGEEV
jgi:hypothetical protein